MLKPKFKKIVIEEMDDGIDIFVIETIKKLIGATPVKHHKLKENLGMGPASMEYLAGEICSKNIKLHRTILRSCKTVQDVINLVRQAKQ